MATGERNAAEIQATIETAIRNELILQLILQELQIRELKICRQVCSRWNNLAMREIQAINWNGRNILDFQVEFDQRSFFETYLNLFRDSPESLPYKCYVFGHPNPRLNNKDLVREFCETFKKQIRGIEFRNGVSPRAQHIIEICGESLEELGISSYAYKISPPELRIKKRSSINQTLLPKLKSISLDIAIHNQNENENVFVQCTRMLRKILSHMRPNSLEELNFHNFGQFPSAVEALIRMKQINKLQKLALYPNPDFQKGDLLVFKNKGINLQLKHLRIHNINPTHSYSTGNTSDIDPDELYDFLVTQKNSLENLNLICSTYTFPSNTVAIKSLEIRILKKEMDVNTLTINFAESFPNLKYLCLWNFWHQQECYRANWDSDQQIISEQKPCYSVLELTLPSELTLSVGPIVRIFRIFPRLSHLEIKAISSEVFQTIWNTEEFASTLKVLVLWIPGRPKGAPIYMKNILQMDEIFSGVTQQEIVSVSAEKYSEEFKLTESQPNSIHKLKNLRKLHLNWIENKRGDQIQPLTDFAGLCIFDKMRNLTDLSVHQNVHGFSAPCVARLKTHMNYSSEEGGEERCHCLNSRGRRADFLKKRMSSRRMFE